MAAGQPVLPLLTYDITLQDTGLSGGAGSGIPEPRGVRLLSAKTLPEISGFNPHITTITTDTTFIQQQDDPDLTVQDQWLPDQPYTFLRTPPSSQYTDKLLINPAQFSATSARSGRLRRFTQLVFEVSYLDPNSAKSNDLDDTTPPEISDVIDHRCRGRRRSGRRSRRSRSRSARTSSDSRRSHRHPPSVQRHLHQRRHPTGSSRP